MGVIVLWGSCPQGSFLGVVVLEPDRRYLNCVSLSHNHGKMINQNFDWFHYDANYKSSNSDM